MLPCTKEVVPIPSQSFSILDTPTLVNTFSYWVPKMHQGYTGNILLYKTHNSYPYTEKTVLAKNKNKV